MFEKTLIASESFYDTDMQRIRASAFYSRECTVLLPGGVKNCHALIEKLGEISFVPKLGKEAVKRGLIQNPRELIPYLESLEDEDAAGDLYDSLFDTVPKRLKRAHELVEDWELVLHFREDELAQLAGEGLIKFPMSEENSFSDLKAEIAEFQLISSALKKHFPTLREAKRELKHWGTKLPRGLPSAVNFFLVSAYQKEAKATFPGMSKKQRKELKEFLEMSGPLMPNLLHAILISLVCNRTSAVPISHHKRQLELIDLMGRVLELDPSDRGEQLAVATSEFVMRRALPNVSEIPVPELLKIREKCLPELESLWTEVRRLSLDAGSDLSDLNREVSHLVGAHIDPAIDALRRSINSSARSTLRSLFSLKPAVLMGSVGYYFSAYAGLTATEQLRNALGSFVASYLPVVADYFLAHDTAKLKETSPYGVVLSLEDASSRAASLKKRKSVLKQMRKRR